MKIKLDLEEIVIPSVIEEAFRKAKDKGLKNKDKEEREWWEKFDDSPSDDAECFKDWWDEDGSEKFQPPEAGLMDKEVANFLVEWELGSLACHDGYPQEAWLVFEADGYRYSICAYAWSGDFEEEYHDISLVGYKEKIEEVKNESKG